jgi:hypothetical protein
MTDDIIDFEEWRRKHENATTATKRKLDNMAKIIEWSAAMHRRGLMPPDIARAFHEYFTSVWPD